MEKICDLPKGYKQLEYFRLKLLAWKGELSVDNTSVMQSLQEEEQASADFTDRASNEVGLAYELRTKERATKLISKINEAIVKIKRKTYGYCDETGEPIGLKRLEARPIATMTIEAQERHEKKEKTKKDD